MIEMCVEKCSKENEVGAVMAFDTLRYANKLKAVGFSEEQAEVQAEALAEIVNENLATKKDLKDSELALRRDIKEAETRLRHEMKEIESGLRHDMQNLGTELRHEMKELELRMTIKLGGLMVSGMGALVLLLKLFKL